MLVCCLVLAVFWGLSAVHATEGTDAPSWKTRPLVFRLNEVPSRALAVTLSQKTDYEIFRLFAAEHPNVSFTSLVPINFVGIEGGGTNRLLLQMASNTAPYLFTYPIKAFDNYLEQNFMVPLNPYLERPEYAWVNDYIARYPALDTVFQREGKRYGIPGSIMTMALQYRKDIFRAAGLAQAPRNWDEFRDALVRLRNRDTGSYGFGVGRSGAELAWRFINFLWQAGTEIIELRNGRAVAVFDNERGAEALDFLRDLFAHDLIYRGERIQEKSQRALIAMTFGYVGTDVHIPDRQNVDVDPLLLGVAPLPRGPRGDYGAEMNCVSTSIGSQVKDPDLREIAFRYIVHQIRPEIRRMRIEAMVRAGYAKYYTSAALREVGLDEYVDQVSPEWDQVSREVAALGRPEPHGPGVRTIYEELGYWLEYALSHPEVPSLSVLRQAADKFNQKMGTVSPQEMKRRRFKVGLGMVAAGVAWAGFIWLTARLLSHGLSRNNAGALGLQPEQRRRPRLRILLAASAFMAPALILVAVWSYWPLLHGSVMAFQNYKVLGDSTWVGIDNFVRAIYGERFRIAFINTLLFAFANLAVGFFVPIVLALLLDEIPRWKRFFRTVYYLPSVTTGLVIMFLWKWFFDASEDGLINQLYAAVCTGIDRAWGLVSGQPLIGPVTPIDWLGQPIRLFGILPLPMLCLIVPGVWAGAGAGCLIYLAALKSIPPEMYEAAEVDGAGLFAKVRAVTVPMLLPLIIINFIGAFVGTFHAMGNILVMTGGGPERMTHVLGLEIWYAAFLDLEFGYATAVAWIVGSMLIGFTIFKLNVLTKAQFRAAHKVEV